MLRGVTHVPLAAAAGAEAVTAHPLLVSVLATVGIVLIGIALGFAAHVLPLPKWRGWRWDGEE